MPDLVQEAKPLTSEFWGVTVYFNPQAIPIQLDNLQRFSQRIREQGLKLLIVELAFGNTAFAVGDGAGDRVVRRRAHAVLWQKERMLNWGMAQLPSTCDKVAWLDGDILFENEDWVAQTADLLDQHVVVQPFDTACWLPRGETSMPPGAPLGVGEGRRLPGFVAGVTANTLPAQRRRALRHYWLSGHTGFAWAARRSLLAAHSLYDRAIVGGGDVLIAHAFLGDEDFWEGRNDYCRHLTPATMAELGRWSRDIDHDVAGRVAYTPGRVLHLWHGDMADRNYMARLQILVDHEFDPARDVTIDESGCWEWNSNKPALHRAVQDYFAARGRSAVEE